MGGQDAEPRPFSLGWMLDKLITPLVIGIVLALFGVFAPSVIAKRLQPPTCSDPRGLVQVALDEEEADGTAKPPDDFPIRGKVEYEAKNLVDGNTSTAWVEGKPGLGLGSSVTLPFEKPADVRLVCVVNGYAESWDLYKRNSRARVLEVTTSEGERFAMLSDAGSPDRPAVYQEVDCPDGRTSQLTLTLRSAYAAQRDGSRTRAYPDTSISEVEVWAKP